MNIDCNYKLVFRPTSGGKPDIIEGHNEVLVGGIDTIVRNSFDLTFTRLVSPLIYLGSGSPATTPTGIITALAVVNPTTVFVPSGVGYANTVSLYGSYPVTYTNLDAVLTEMAVYLRNSGSSTTDGNVNATAGTAINYITLNYDNTGPSGPASAIDATIIFRFSA